MAKLSESGMANPLILSPSASAEGRVEPLSQDSWRLQIPAGPAGTYRLAQLDNYSNLPRRNFPSDPPLTLALEARLSTQETIPGTWGFGLWNDPFSLSFGFGGGARRFPTLPNAAWFFFASPPNYLSLRDDLPAVGSLAASFRSAQIPALLLTPGALLTPVLALPFLARNLRKLARRVISQAAAILDLDPSTWHEYRLDWRTKSVKYWVDGDLVLESGVSPYGPLGLVIWIDNQYAALLPDGRLRYGTLATAQTVWMEVRRLTIA